MTALQATDMTATITDAQTAHAEIKLILAAAEARAAADRADRVTAACAGWTAETSSGNVLARLQGGYKLDSFCHAISNGNRVLIESESSGCAPELCLLGISRFHNQVIAAKFQSVHVNLVYKEGNT